MLLVRPGKLPGFPSPEPCFELESAASRLGLTRLPRPSFLTCAALKSRDPPRQEIDSKIPHTSVVPDAEGRSKRRSTWIQSGWKNRQRWKRKQPKRCCYKEASTSQKLLIFVAWLSALPSWLSLPDRSIPWISKFRYRAIRRGHESSHVQIN